MAFSQEVEEDFFFSLHRAFKYNKGDGSTAPFTRSKFQLLFSSEQISWVGIISVINKCSLLIWKIPATFATQASYQHKTQKIAVTTVLRVKVFIDEHHKGMKPRASPFSL